MCTTEQVRATAGLRGACSERSKSRDLTGNHGVAFRDAETAIYYWHPGMCDAVVLDIASKVSTHPNIERVLPRVLYAHMHVCRCSTEESMYTSN